MYFVQNLLGQVNEHFQYSGSKALEEEVESGTAGWQESPAK